MVHKIIGSIPSSSSVSRKKSVWEGGGSRKKVCLSVYVLVSKEKSVFVCAI